MSDGNDNRSECQICGLKGHVTSDVCAVAVKIHVNANIVRCIRQLGERCNELEEEIRELKDAS